MTGDALGHELGLPHAFAGRHKAIVRGLADQDPARAPRLGELHVRQGRASTAGLFVHGEQATDAILAGLQQLIDGGQQRHGRSLGITRAATVDVHTITRDGQVARHSVDVRAHHHLRTRAASQHITPAGSKLLLLDRQPHALAVRCQRITVLGLLAGDTRDLDPLDCALRQRVHGHTLPCTPFRRTTHARDSARCPRTSDLSHHHCTRGGCPRTLRRTG